jgi:transposase
MELSHGSLIDFLRRTGHRIFSLNPLKIKRFKENFRVSGNKNDQIDAQALSGYLLQNFTHCRPMLFSSDAVEKLKILGISYDRMIGEQTRMTCRLIFILKQYFPLLANAFANRIPRILLKMLQRYRVWRDLCAARFTELQSFLIENRYRNQKFIDRFFAKIDRYEHCVSEHTESALSMEAQSICRILLIIKADIEKIKAEMSAITSSCKLGKVFQSLPGVGLVLSGKLLGIIGDNKSRFTCANQVQSLFGTAPVNYQSGGYHKVIFRRACNKRGRGTLYYMAFSTMRHSA